MKRTKKRLIALLMLFPIIFIQVPAMASVKNINETSIDIVIKGEGLSDDKIKLIESSLLEIESIETDDASIQNILCIFGHSITTVTAYKLIHNYYSTAPRCLEEKYNVEICTRSGCDYAVSVLIRVIRIPCC